MTLNVQLLGVPCLQRMTGPAYKFRSRKSWALLAYLILNEHPPTRRQLAALLFAEAKDPIRALRWSLFEIRRGLDEDGSVDGDPVVLELSPNAIVDVQVVAHGSWVDAVRLKGLGSGLLDSLVLRDAPAFESWLLSEQCHVAAASEAILHEAALSSRSRGQFEVALGYAARAASMSPLDENHQALLIRLYRLTGDEPAAKKQYVACTEMLERELAIAPGAAVEMAMSQSQHEPEPVSSIASIEAIVEAGSAAVSAGATHAGVESLRTAVRLC